MSDAFWAYRPKPRPLPRVLIWDVERAPSRSYHYGIWDISINRTGVDMNPWIYCFAAKWKDEPSTAFHAVWHDPDAHGGGLGVDYNVNMVMKAWNLLDQADVLVSFNGKVADTKWMGNEFARWDIEAPSPARQIDLRWIAKRHFDFPFKGLNDLCKYLEVPGKLDAPLRGIPLYRQAVEQGDPIARGIAEKYNVQDVLATEGCLLKMEERSWL